MARNVLLTGVLDLVLNQLNTRRIHHREVCQIVVSVWSLRLRCRIRADRRRRSSGLTLNSSAVVRATATVLSDGDPFEGGLAATAAAKPAAVHIRKRDEGDEADDADDDTCDCATVDAAVQGKRL